MSALIPIIILNNKRTLIGCTTLYTALFLRWFDMCLTYNDQGKQRHESDSSEAIPFTRRVTKYYNCNSVSSTACFTLSAERETIACDLDLL